MNKQQKQHYFTRCKRLFDPIVIVLAFAVIPIIILPDLIELNDYWKNMLQLIDWIIWSVFLIELVMMSYLASSAKQYLKQNWIDIVVVIISIPFLFSVFKVMRVARLGRALKLFRVASLTLKALGETRTFFGRHNFARIVCAATVLIIVLGLLGAQIEMDSTDANISGAGDGLWWAITTVTTVGYGDHYPVTTGGKFVGIILMVIGITVYSILIANIASLFVEEDESKFQEEVLTLLHQLLEQQTHDRQRIDQLEEQLQEYDLQQQ